MRISLPIAVAAVVSALALTLVSTAAAATTRIADGKRETTALAKNGRVDIIRASSARFAGDVRYAVTMRSRVRSGNEAQQPEILINTRGGNSSDAEYVIVGDDLFDVRGNDAERIAPVQAAGRGRTWSMRFDRDAIPSLDRYGWAATTKAGKARDVAPNGRYVETRA